MSSNLKLTWDAPQSLFDSLKQHLAEACSDMSKDMLSQPDMSFDAGRFDQLSQKIRAATDLFDILNAGDHLIGDTDMIMTWMDSWLKGE